MPAVIVENDTSMWDDQTGVLYHYPKRYEKILKRGTDVLYYKGRIKDKGFASQRLSSSPHYFGLGRIGEIFNDQESKKGDLFARIEGFTPFEFPVPAKINGRYLETIPNSKLSNYWRDGVRYLEQEDYLAILRSATLKQGVFQRHPHPVELADFESYVEGSEYRYFGTRYERDAALRSKAIEIHGLICKACGFDFEATYGEYAQGLIHVHHLVPISTFGGKKSVDPATDMITLCANCHAVVHRRRDLTLSLAELVSLIKVRWIPKE